MIHPSLDINEKVTSFLDSTKKEVRIEHNLKNIIERISSI